jgi:cytochrome c oxidase assembly factor CtaG/cytochrome c2
VPLITSSAGSSQAVAQVLAQPPLDGLTAPGSGRFADLSWNWEVWILVCLGLAVFGYLCGLRRLHAHARSRIFGVLRIVSFAAGIVTLFVALISPLDALDDQLFSAHMVQHLLLMMVAAPLLVWSRPAMAFLWAFPISARRVIGRLWIGGGLHRGVQALMSPLVVWMLCSMVLWFWHLPGPYGWALDNEGVHTVEHFCFFITALMFWSLVIEPFGRRRLDYGSTLIFVATLGVQNGLLGALLTLAGHPFYPAHFDTTVPWGLTPLEDQQLAGIIMWIPASLIHLTSLALLFVLWMQHAERQARLAAAVRATTASSLALQRYAGMVMIIVALVGLGGCDRRGAQSPWAMSGAHADRGPALMKQYGCDACHTIAGVANARGEVGPPLAQFGRRAYIAGVLINNPDNLVKWLRAPQSIVPGNAMPNTGLTEQDARDIAAYLYSDPT